MDLTSIDFAQLDIKFVTIYRLVLPNKETEVPKAEHFTFSSYPFTDLGILPSHIHPKFLICHVAAMDIGKMNQVMGYYSWAGRAILDLVLKCMEIIALWSPFADDVASKHSGFLKSQTGSDDVYSETSDRTANCRLRPHLSERRLIEEHGYVYIKEDEILRLKHVEDSPQLLTAKKLKIFEEKMIQNQTIEGQWDVIEFWRSDRLGTPEEQE